MASAIPPDRVAELLAAFENSPAGGRHARLTRGGFAASPEAMDARLSQLDPLPFAYASWWEPGEPLAMPVETCRRLREAVGRRRLGVRERWRPEDFDIFAEDVDPDTLDAVISRQQEANRLWWGLDVRLVSLGLKRYTVDKEHPEHTDLQPEASTDQETAWRKFAFMVQLSEPDEYEGGGLVLRIGGQEVLVPDLLGVTCAIPAWTPHFVEPITWGERWSLVVSGYGPRPR